MEVDIGPREIADRIDHGDEGPVASGLLQVGDQVDVGEAGVGAPDQDGLGVGVILEGDPGHPAVHALGHSGCRGRAEGALEARCAQFRKETGIEKLVAQQSVGPVIVVRKDGFGAPARDDGLETLGDGGEGVVPGDPLEAPFSFGADTAKRV
jgi:hypothetical protein